MFGKYMMSVSCFFLKLDKWILNSVCYKTNQVILSVIYSDFKIRYWNTVIGHHIKLQYIDIIFIDTAIFYT